VKKPLKEELKKTFTVRALIIGVIYTVLIVLFLNAGGWFAASQLVKHAEVEEIWPLGILYGTGWSMRPRTLLLDYIGFLLPLVLVNGVISKKLRLSASEMTLIFSMILPAITFGSPFISGAIMTVGRRIQDPVQGQFIQQYASPLWAPKSLEVINPMAAGGVIVPWSEWIVPIVFFIAFYLAAFSMGTFASVILSELWIRRETLPFPLATVYTKTIQLTSPEEERKSYWRNSMFWIGFLISLVIGLIYIIGNFIPSLGYPLKLAWDMSPLRLAPLVFAFTFEPWTLGMGLIVPLSIAVTVPIIYFITMIIVPPITVSTGLSDTAFINDAWSDWIFYTMVSHDGYVTYEGGWMPFFLGILIALGFVPLVRERKTLVAMIRSALGKEEAEGEEMGSLMRISWIGLIVSSVILWALMIAVSQSVLASLVLMLYTVAWWVGYGRFRAESGIYMGMPHEAVGSLFYEHSTWGYIQQAIPGGTDPVAVWNLPLVNAILNTMHISNPSGLMNPIMWSPELYKTGYDLKARFRDLFSAQFIAVILSLIIGVPFTLWLCYTYGYQGRWTQNPYLGFDTSYFVQQGTSWPPNIQWNMFTFVLFFIGFAICTALLLARVRYGGIFALISPAGILLANTSGPMIWLPFLVAAIIKKLTYRVGGADLFERRVMPLAIGLILGFSLLVIPSGLAMFLRGMRVAGVI